MTTPIEVLTPREIVAELDRYIIGQEAAKRAVAVALRNRYRRQRLSPEAREDVLPKNILMIGPTGVGKTELARRLAHLARAPFVKVEATKFTEVGYVGRDVESMVRDLVATAVRLVETERMDSVREDAMAHAIERIVDKLEEAEHPPVYSAPIFHLPFEDSAANQEPEVDWEAEAERRRVLRERLRAEVVSGARDDETVEVEVEEAANPFVQVFSPQGIEEMGFDTNPAASPFGTRTTYRTVSIADAKVILFEQEARKLLDKQGIHREAIHRTEQTGIIFIDEIDKVAGKSGGSGPDVSREGVQRDLLPVIEGSTVQTKFGPVRTDHILFIAAGAFHISKPSDLIPELQGRLPIRVELHALSQDDFLRILKEPKNALAKQYRMLLEADGLELTFADDALEEIARLARQVNETIENIGARRLHTLLERLLEHELFEAPSDKLKQVHVTGTLVRERLEPLVAELERSRAIL